MSESDSGFPAETSGLDVAGGGDVTAAPDYFSESAEDVKEGAGSSPTGGQYYYELTWHTPPDGNVALQNPAIVSAPFLRDVHGALCAALVPVTDKTPYWNGSLGGDGGPDIEVNYAKDRNRAVIVVPTDTVTTQPQTT